MSGFLSECKQREKTSHLRGDSFLALSEKVFIAPFERIHYDSFRPMS